MLGGGAEIILIPEIANNLSIDSVMSKIAKCVHIWNAQAGILLYNTLQYCSMFTLQ